MKKIISLFQRNYDGDHLVRDEIVPGAEWVVAGEGLATRKWDGTCCMVRDGKLYRRYDAKRGKTPPPGWEAAQDPDPITGHHPGWLLVGDEPASKWHKAAFSGFASLIADGTYELCGPHFQTNPEGFADDRFLRHGNLELPDAPRTFQELACYFAKMDIEGIVWHHPDGRMVKIKAADFGHKRRKV